MNLKEAIGFIDLGMRPIESLLSQEVKDAWKIIRNAALKSVEVAATPANCAKGGETPKPCAHHTRFLADINSPIVCEDCGAEIIPTWRTAT